MNDTREVVTPLHRVTFLVPAQRFLTHFSVTRGLSLAVVDEFALRLLAVCGPIDAGEFVRFFGFNSREGAEVLRSLVARDFVVAPEGMLSLSDHGRSLFPTGPGDPPRIVAVDERSDTLRMDLLDFRLVEEARGDVSLGVGVPIELPETFRSSDSPESVGRAFQEQFGAYALNRGFDRETRLYATLSVEPRTRFQLPIELDVNLRLGAGVAVELDLPREEDSNLGREVHGWFNAQCGQHLDDRSAWLFMKSLVPELQDVPPSLARIRDFALRRFGSDLTALVGSLSMPVVADAVAAFVEERSEQLGQPCEYLCWSPAASEFWFRSRSSWSAVDVLRNATEQETAPASVLALREPWPEDDLRALRKRFNEVVLIGGDVPPSVEVVLVPGAWCAVWAWLKVDGPGVPLPVGFVTTRPSIVGRLSELFTAKSA